MMVNDILLLLLAGVAGAALGLVFFGGLWYTVRRLLKSSRPLLLLVVSFVVRTSLTLSGFYLLISGQSSDWKHLLAALVGFFLVRVLLMRQLGPAALVPDTAEREKL